MGLLDFRTVFGAEEAGAFGKGLAIDLGGCAAYASRVVLDNDRTCKPLDVKPSCKDMVESLLVLTCQRPSCHLILVEISHGCLFYL